MYGIDEWMAGLTVLTVLPVLTTPSTIEGVEDQRGENQAVGREETTERLSQKSDLSTMAGSRIEDA
jgi:hypothetical protein